MTDTLDDKSLTVKRKSGAGTGSHGFFLEVVQAAENDELELHHRFFLAGDMLCTYERKKGAKRTNWSFEKFSDHDEARTKLLSILIMLKPGRCVMNGGSPLLVELDAKDVQAVESSQPPPARFLATQMMERKAPVDDKTWRMPKAGS